MIYLLVFNVVQQKHLNEFRDYREINKAETFFSGFL